MFVASRDKDSETSCCDCCEPGAARCKQMQSMSQEDEDDDGEALSVDPSSPEETVPVVNWDELDYGRGWTDDEDDNGHLGGVAAHGRTISGADQGEADLEPRAALQPDFAEPFACFTSDSGQSGASQVLAMPSPHTLPCPSILLFLHAHQTPLQCPKRTSRTGTLRLH